MTFSIQSVQPDPATGCVVVSLTKPVGKPFPDSVVVRLALSTNASETQDALALRAKQATRRALQDALASL